MYLSPNDPSIQFDVKQINIDYNKNLTMTSRSPEFERPAFITSSYSKSLPFSHREITPADFPARASSAATVFPAIYPEVTGNSGIIHAARFPSLTNAVN